MASVTRYFDTDQLYFEPKIVSTEPAFTTLTNKWAQKLTIRVPSNDQAPAGYYMLFVIDSDLPPGPSGPPPGALRAPSTAHYIRLHS